MIQIDEVTKIFSKGAGELVAVDHVSFNVPTGTFATVVGPSGCGKSTLLMMAAGLAKPTSGRIRVLGRVVEGPKPEEVGVVFQDATLLPWKTAIENITFPLELSGVTKSIREVRADELLTLVELKDFAHNFPHELSGGMRQRVGIARGLAHDPGILLMDEPFSALDEQNRTKLGHELLEIWERTKKTVLFITHSLTEALYLSDVVYVISRGPGKIIERVDVELPRPRDYDVIGSVEFGRLRNHIWHLLTDEKV